MYVCLVVLSYGLLYRPFCKLSSHSVAVVEARSMLDDLRTRPNRKIRRKDEFVIWDPL